MPFPYVLPGARWLASRRPGVQRIGLVPHGQPKQTWLIGGDGSWACLEKPDVWQGGPRRLWDLLEAVYRDRFERGCPARPEIGLTVAANGEHRIWTGARHQTGWLI